ncbi:MAG: stage II sporulation protein D [Oscillospiraceae bacterium]|nr:stage II sporulation protein D [Oscillospiraceae bacterium]
MRRVITTSLLLAMAALLAAVSFSCIKHETTPQREASPKSSDSGEPQANELLNCSDHSVNIKLLDKGQVKTLCLDEYLIGVVAAEMPADFDIEALKAQAVAARTYTMYKLFAEPSASHPEADVCSDIKCCKAYSTGDTLKAKWGTSYENNLKKITDAVRSTDGQYLKYEGEPILAVFHSCSAGTTERSENVWSRALPYLVCVDTPETEADVPGYSTTVTVLKSDYMDSIRERFPDVDFSRYPLIGEISLTEGGRVDGVVTGGVSVSGTLMRSIFELRSAAFEMEEHGDDVVFHVSGYGHGVGMSQYGANVLAHSGSNYIEILSWYYPGTALGNISELY